MAAECTSEQKTTWGTGCGCGWKETTKTNYDYTEEDADKSAEGLECQKDAWGVGPGKYCCNQGHWTGACGRGWEEPYGPVKNDYQIVKTAVADKQTGWICVAKQWGAGPDESCCKKSKSGAGAKTTGAALPTGGSTAKWISSVPGGLVLVPCTEKGECQIADLVQQAINFAKWLMGLAGALFLLVFVYGGAMYLASFGNSAWVTKGKTALTRGAIGIVLVMGAWTIIAYVTSSLGYAGGGAAAGGSKGICGQATGTEGRTCMDTTKEGQGKDCLQSYCPGAANIQCCK